MQRFVHRAGVGVIAWRQASGAAVATTCAPRDNHRRVVSRGRVVRGVVGCGVSGSGNASGALSAVTLAAVTGTSTGKATATTTPAEVTLVAVTGSASATGGGTGNAVGSLSTVTLAAAAGAATGSASAFAAFMDVVLTPVTGSASSAATATIARPTGDVSNTGWAPSTGVDLYAMVDEVTPSAVDYISSDTVGQVCEMALNPTAYPGTASQALKFRGSSTTGNSVIVRLKEGATTIRSSTQLLTASDTEYTITLTSGEIAAITSGSLSVELESA